MEQHRLQEKTVNASMHIQMYVHIVVMGEGLLTRLLTHSLSLLFTINGA